jgi:Tfp pilus assembly protein PilO
VNRKLLIVTGVLCAVLALGWYQFSWQASAHEMGVAHEATDKARTQADELRAQLTKLVAAKGQLPALQATAARLQQAVPDDAELASFLRQANDAATSSGVDYLSIAPTPPAPASAGIGSTEVHLGISVSGQYAKVIDYLEHLLGLPRVVVIDTMSVSPSGAGPGAGSLSVTLAGRVFLSSPPAQAAATGATPAATATASATPTTVGGGS